MHLNGCAATIWFIARRWCRHLSKYIDNLSKTMKFFFSVRFAWMFPADVHKSNAFDFEPTNQTFFRLSIIKAAYGFSFLYLFRNGDDYHRKRYCACAIPKDFPRLSKSHISPFHSNDCLGAFILPLIQIQLPSNVIAIANQILNCPFYWYFRFSRMNRWYYTNVCLMMFGRGNVIWLPKFNVQCWFDGVFKLLF